MKKNLQEIANNLVLAQKKSGLSGVDICKKTGIDPSIYSKYRNADLKITEQNLALIAAAIGCKPIDIDPDFDDFIKKQAGIILEAQQRVLELNQEWTRLNQEIVSTYSEIASYQLTIQRMCAQAHAEIEERRDRMKEIERELSLTVVRINVENSRVVEMFQPKAAKG